jgi:hypothetical protein
MTDIREDKNKRKVIRDNKLFWEEDEIEDFWEAYKAVDIEKYSPPWQSGTPRTLREDTLPLTSPRASLRSPTRLCVRITPKAHAEIMHYVHKASGEVSGLGRIERASDGTMVVTKVYLLDQENGAASTDISQDAVAKLLFETRADAGSLNFWWHSHVNMACFWSGTDLDTIRQLGDNGYILSTVFNKQGDYRTSYYQGATPDSFLPPIFVDEIPTVFDYLPTASDRDAWDKEFGEKCKERTGRLYDGLYRKLDESADRYNITKGEFYDRREKPIRGEAKASTTRRGVYTNRATASVRGEVKTGNTRKSRASKLK